MLAYELMGNHDHFLRYTRSANPSRRIAGVYSQPFNRRHGRVGHVLQGRDMDQAHREGGS